MAKYTDEQIFEYLRTLSEGDVLTPVKDSDEFYTTGKQYPIVADDDGDLLVYDNADFKDYVRIGGGCGCEIADYFREGVFEIPTQDAAAKPFFLEINVLAYIADGGLHKIEIHADSAGLAKLFALESEGSRLRVLEVLYEERAEIQAQIDALEAD